LLLQQLTPHRPEHEKMNKKIQIENSIAVDLTGTAYGRPQQHSNDMLTRVGPGTPCGEYMRRYWQPVAASEKVTTRPRKIRILGEDLVIFRDKRGNPGLLYPRCIHRGTTLYYGRVEDEGIRCCYHGWLFDVQGNCLDQPCEPQGGENKHKIRQPWYPVKEHYGLVFAYMGPPDKMPVLPRFENLENLQAGEQVYGIEAPGGGYGDFKMQVESTPYNWLQVWENIMDPYHVWVLHSTFTETQFAEGFKIKPHKVEFEDHPLGCVYNIYRDLDDGRSVRRTSFAMLPNVAIVPSVELADGQPDNVVWFVPVDDTHFTVMFASRAKGRPPLESFRIPLTPDGKTWSEMSEEEHRDYPGDFEAQWGQGEITLHSEEHLARSDIGVIQLRKKMKKNIKSVQNDASPEGVAFTEDEALVKVVSGNFYT